MKHRQFRMLGWIWNCDWEETGIFVIHVAQFRAVPMRIGCETETLPMKEILRHGQGYARTLGRKCSVRHDVVLKWFHISHARILATAAAVRETMLNEKSGPSLDIRSTSPERIRVHPETTA